jgi:hypothetical protein
MGGVAKEYITKLGSENIFARSHTKHCWRCSYSPKVMGSNLFLKLFFSFTNKTNGNEFPLINFLN